MTPNLIIFAQACDLSTLRATYTVKITHREQEFFNKKMENIEQEFIATIRTYERVIYKVCYMYATTDTPLNDLYQEVVLNLWKALGKFRHECKISTWIYRIALNTCISFIRKGKNTPEIVTLTPAFDRTEDDDETETMLRQLYQMINRLGQQTQRLETAFDNGFSLGAIRMRDKKRSSLLGNISEKIKERFFKDKKSLFNPKNYTTYVTEDVTSAAHNELRDELLKAKKEVTNNIPSIHENIKSKLGSFSHDIKPDDEALRTISQSIKQKLEKFKSCSGSDEQKVRDKISKEISSLIDDAQVLLKDNLQYSPSEQAEMAAKLNSIKSSVLSTGQSSKGALEEIMTIIKGLNSASAGKNGAKIISDESYKELSKLSSKISKGLADAVKLEADEYFLKQAELKVGSAPTDVLSVLFPIGVSAYAIGKGEDKDDRISATLTTCIPLIGTFATFVYGTVKMYSGAKNLIFSFVTGAIISKLGNYCDKLYKIYKDSGSIVKVAKEEYNNFWTDLTPQYAETLKNKEAK